MMQAYEFKSKIRDNRIWIPHQIQLELETRYDQPVRVVILLEDAKTDDEKAYRQMEQEQFLQGYADTDAVYDLE